MKMTRRSLFGAFLSLPLVRGVTLKPKPEADTPERIMVNRRPIEPCLFDSITDAWDENRQGYSSTATFRSKRGLYAVGESIEITFDGTILFSGLIRLIQRHPTYDFIECVDRLSLLPPIHYMRIDPSMTAEVAREVGEEILRSMKTARSFGAV